MSEASAQAAFPGRALSLAAKTPAIGALAFARERRSFARRRDDEIVVAIGAASVNQSDAKAALGVIAQAAWPRTPGRDFAGIVVDGPAALLGREVFGTGGDLGITRDGSHASHLVLPAAAACLKPATLSLCEAGSLGVPFVTAQEGFSRAGMPRADETVLVFGVNGKVGQAATQIATLHGARVIGVARDTTFYAGHASGAVAMVDGAAANIVAQVRDLTGGHGADIVFNAVGSPYFEAAQDALALDGRHVIMASIAAVVPLRILDFYHRRHSFFGVDSLALDATASAQRLAALLPGFARGALRPFAIEGGVYPWAEAEAAYAAALGPGRARIVLVPDA